jgi:hypothetical protein
MSTPALAPVEKKFDWKRLFIKAAGFGAGFCVMLMAIVVAGVWYENRPKTPEGWNRTAITVSMKTSAPASMESTHTGESKPATQLTYVVSNNTDFDYELPAHFKLMVRKGDALADYNSAFIQEKLFVPARQKSEFFVIDSISPEDRKALVGVDRFVLFDEGKHYQIEFPYKPAS